ncbi:MAG: TRAP transporter small permease [Rhizobiaceae bacterium]|nr:TRAP transporter small permease [Rhizobiaceae bacterium]
MMEHEKTGPVDWLTWTFSRVMMWGPAFIVAIIFYEVIMRYIFFSPTLWVNEMSLWAGGMIFVTAGLYSMQQRSHIRIFVLYDMAPLWLRRVFDVISTLCVLIFAFAVVWGGFGEAIAKFWRWEAFGTAWDPPIPATNKPLVLVTVTVLALQAASNLIRDWPANPIVRKTFDILASTFVVSMCLWALPNLFSGAESELKTPLHWRLFIAALLVSAIGLTLFGLFRDFNRTPQPLDEPDMEDDHGIPDQVLSGNPPLEEQKKQ